MCPQWPLTLYHSEGYLTVENDAGDRNDLNAWHGGVCTTNMALKPFPDA